MRTLCKNIATAYDQTHAPNISGLKAGRCSTKELVRQIYKNYVKLWP